MLKIRNLQLYYDNIILAEKINLEISAPGIYSILGRSGCGKSSLLKALIGENTSYRGEILYGGQELKDIPDFDLFLRNNIFYADADYNFFPNHTAFENLMLLCTKSELTALPSYEVRYNLKDLYHKHISQLSLGEKQRILIVIMLLKNKRINYLDEILCNLDSTYLSLVREDFLKFSRDKIILMVSHKAEDIEDISTAVLLFDKTLEYQNIGKIKPVLTSQAEKFAASNIKTRFHWIPVLYFSFLSVLILIFMLAITVISTSTQRSAENILTKETTIFDYQTQFEVSSGYPAVRLFNTTYKDENNKEYDIYNTFVFTDQIKIDGTLYMLEKGEVIVPNNFLFQSYLPLSSETASIKAKQLGGIGLLGYLDSTLIIKYAYDVVNTLPTTDYSSFLDENVIYMTEETMNDIVLCQSIPTLLNLNRTNVAVQDYYGDKIFNEYLMSYSVFRNYPAADASDTFDKSFRIIVSKGTEAICIPYENIDPLVGNEIYISNSFIQYLNYLNKTYTTEQIYEASGVLVDFSEILDIADTEPLKPITIAGTRQSLADKYIGKSFTVFLSTKEKYTEVRFKIKGIIIDEFGSSTDNCQALSLSSHSILSDEYFQEITQKLEYNGLFSYADESFKAYNLKDSGVRRELARRLIEIEKPSDYMNHIFYQYLKQNQDYRLSAYFIAPIALLLGIGILYFLNKMIALQNKENINIMRGKGYLDKEILHYKNKIIYKILIPLVIILELVYFFILFILRTYARFYYYQIGFEWVIPVLVFIVIWIKNRVELKRRHKA